MRANLHSKGCCIVFLSIFLLSQVCSAVKPDVNEVKKRMKGKGYTFEVGENPATEYSLEEITGWKPSPKLFPKKLKAVLPPQDLPEHLDWRELGGCTPVKNQGSCGSCWALAAMGVVESQYLIRCNLEMDFSEQWLVSCTDAGTCNGGNYGPAFSYMMDTSDSCNSIGAMLETDYPYEARDADCS